VTIAYQVIGDGPIDFVMALPAVSHLEVEWEDPSFARLFQRVSSFSRLILFDKRGVGMSDRISGVATLEERMDDLRAVMDAVGSEKAVIFGASEGGPMGMLFAATFPERTTALIIYGSIVWGGWREDDPLSLEVARTREAYDELVAADDETIRRDWGSSLGWEALSPSRAHDPAFTAFLERLLRFGSSPSALIALNRMNREIDVSDVLPAIQVPTLVLHRRDDRMARVENGRYLAEHIPGAKYVELDGCDHLPLVEEMDVVVGEIEEFITGVRSGPDSDRVLATLLFTDIVGSTDLAAKLGDRVWVELLDTHDRTVRDVLRRFRGQEVNTTGDGFLASFDGPARALRCARSIVEAEREHQIEIRAGVHTGECERRGRDLGGLAVHVAARVCALASAGEVLATGTVKDLVAGSGVVFGDRGVHQLKGVPDEWRVFEVESV